MKVRKRTCLWLRQCSKFVIYNFKLSFKALCIYQKFLNVHSFQGRAWQYEKNPERYAIRNTHSLMDYCNFRIALSNINWLFLTHRWTGRSGRWCNLVWGGWSMDKCKRHQYSWQWVTITQNFANEFFKMHIWCFFCRTTWHCSKVWSWWFWGLASRMQRFVWV